MNKSTISDARISFNNINRKNLPVDFGMPALSEYEKLITAIKEDGVTTRDFELDFNELPGMNTFESTQINSFLCFSRNKITPTVNNPCLLVEFKDGSRYLYLGVTDNTAFMIVNAESVGRYFSANIKGNYTCYKLEEKDSDEDTKENCLKFEGTLTKDSEKVVNSVYENLLNLLASRIVDYVERTGKDESIFFKK